MNLRAVAAGTSLALVTLLAGCGSDDPPSAAPDTEATPTAEPQPTDETTEEPREEPEPDGTVITTGPSEFGPMLFDENHQAIYIWELEPTSKPECYDDCADAWPPVLTEGEPVAEGKVRPRLLGTTKRSDGTTQVTYNDQPLYYYADEAPGEVKCHNIATHGGLWWVVQPGGDRAP